MMQYPGNVQLSVNILDWLDRHATGTRSRNLVFVHGNTALYGDPRPFINDPRGGKVSRSVAELNALIGNADKSPSSFLVLACILRDHVQALLATALPGSTSEPLYVAGESELVKRLAKAKGDLAGAALGRVYRPLRALPSRGQAAAPWSSGSLSRREFDALYRDVAELCRTLGSPLIEAAPDEA